MAIVFQTLGYTGIVLGALSLITARLFAFLFRDNNPSDFINHHEGLDRIVLFIGFFIATVFFCLGGFFIILGYLSSLIGILAGGLVMLGSASSFLVFSWRKRAEKRYYR